MKAPTRDSDVLGVPRMVKSFSALLLACLLFGSGCAESPAPAAAPPAKVKEKKNRGKKLVQLEVKFGEESNLQCEAYYKVYDLNSRQIRKFQVEIVGDKPGNKYTVDLDGVRLGEFRIQPDGEGELEFEDGDMAFPSTFQAPKEGSVVKVGDKWEVILVDLLKPADPPKAPVK